MVKVIDNETNEIIKEIPSEKMLDMVAKIEEMIGLIIDEKA
jgi:flagellar protein FlaG